MEFYCIANEHYHKYQGSYYIPLYNCDWIFICAILLILLIIQLNLLICSFIHLLMQFWSNMCHYICYTQCKDESREFAHNTTIVESYLLRKRLLPFFVTYLFQNNDNDINITIKSIGHDTYWTSIKETINAIKDTYEETNQFLKQKLIIIDKRIVSVQWFLSAYFWYYWCNCWIWFLLCCISIAHNTMIYIHISIELFILQ